MTKPILRCLAVAAMLTIAATGCGHRAPITTKNSAAGTSNMSGGTAVVAQGTSFYGKLQQPINTKTSHDGDVFALAQTDTLFHKNPALHGSIVEGHVEDVRSAGPMRKPALTLVFDDIRMADGSKAPIQVQLESLSAFEPKTHHMRTLAMMVGGAIAGHELAKRTGKRHGGLTGAAGAYVLSQTLKTDISVPAGTVLVLKFKQPVTAQSGS